jgi:hypothetical protein
LSFSSDNVRIGDDADDGEASTRWKATALSRTVTRVFGGVHEVDLEFLVRLQGLHDNCDSSYEFLEKFRNFGKNHGLDISFLTEGVYDNEAI